MTGAEIDRYKSQLITLAKRIAGDVSALSEEALERHDGQASGNLSNTPLHLADLGTDNYDQEITLTLLENEDKTLEAIRAAVERIEQGTFGRCVRCHKEISKERLGAVPYSPFCVECARLTEPTQPVVGDPDVS